jgi:signal transduction histidine kinase
MEAGAVEFAFEPLDPAGLLRGVVADFQQEADAKGYHIELAANGDAPPIRGNRESLRRAVRNLLENAVKYSPGCRTIWVELGQQAKQVAIRVRDRGIGIPPGEQASVFDKFVRGREAKLSNIPGTGLGLAMVRQIARSHGGRVEVRSRPGEGSTFTLLLPALE